MNHFPWRQDVPSAQRDQRQLGRTRSARLGSFAATFAILVLVTLAVVASPATASHDVDNSHTTNGVFHGYTRRYHAFDGGYHFHAWSDHGHGEKNAYIQHDNASHLHCNNVDNVDHVHCDAHVSTVNHSSAHDAPNGSSQTFNDGHGIGWHIMEAIYS
jgi:glyoxylate utilization-related uncharacterized protein